VRTGLDRSQNLFQTSAFPRDKDHPEGLSLNVVLPDGALVRDTEVKSWSAPELSMRRADRAASIEDKTMKIRRRGISQRRSRKLTCLAVIMFAVVEISNLLAFCEFAGAADNPGRIAFQMGPNIYSMKPDGSDLKQLTNVGQNTAAGFQSWSFDGKQLVLTEVPPNAPPELWLMNADGTDQHLVFDDGNFQDWAPSFSPDNSLIIFTRCQPTWPAFTTSCAIYSVKPDGTRLAPVTHFSPAVNEWEANYSPDGKFISFEAFGLGGFSAAVWLMNPDGSEIHRITKPAPCASDANWSPDTKKVAVWTVTCTYGTPQVWTMNADGTDIKHLTHTQLPIANVNPSWSPDGNFITFERDNYSKGTSAIFVISAEGNDERQLIEFPRSNQSPLFHLRTGRHGATLRPRQIEQGGGFPKWGPAQ
jgi:Tol biopolymer transport system component